MEQPRSISRSLAILGTRGIPANHGGFETFAEKLSRTLAGQGWDVVVYCQKKGCGHIVTRTWEKVRLVEIPVRGDNPLSTIMFDIKAMIHACRGDHLILTLGYNTAFLGVLARLSRKTLIINMDGIEWRRAKWSFPVKVWFYINERIGCILGNYLVADHPEIKSHLSRHESNGNVTMIPYGAERIKAADEKALEVFGVRPQSYALIVARPEPENSILEIVTAFSRQPRGIKLVVLGEYKPEDKVYHRKVLNAAGDEVLFPGALYDQELLNTLRFYTLFYIHGHSAGGTNPALVEAMGAGCAILAHDNKFNQWVTNSKARYFSTIDDCDRELSHLISDVQDRLNIKKQMIRRHEDLFRWEPVISQYEGLFLNALGERVD